MKRLPLQALAGLLGLVVTASAQGSDSCAVATPIAGLGTFAWSNTTATQSVEEQATCVTNVYRDVWFTWTATATDQFTLSNCALMSLDTVFAVYAGAGCPTGPSIGCNDQGCGNQSRVTFSAVAGNAYTFELGQFFNTTGAAGSFTLTQGGPVGCTPAVGPDVIVGDVSDVGNYAVLGALDALALGTTSCNMGNANLSWVGSTTQHPVIGGNLYRYKTVAGAPRFEQIGLSWLKHGFAAAQGSLCCTCQGTGSGQALGVGCSDPYGSGLNGSQSGLGPRWEVNASTGVFVMPHANPPWSGSTARRIEVLLTDIEPSGTGTRYFGECQYVTPDDAAAGNQNNNASWRELTVSGTSANYNFAVSGLTQRAQSAIRAWQQIDAQVQLSDVQVPGDGLFVVGSRAYDLGGGQWRYEYAVYNMNSHRSGGAFSIPVPAGVNVTNAGFHGVTYRNGDGPGNIDMSNADWTFALAGGVATWSTETEAQNVRANAVRWGSTYNFRFDCDAAPTGGLASLGLWRGGAPAAMDAAVQVPGTPNGSGAICFGDGTGTACPCANDGALGEGCRNSLGTGGTIAATGTASVSADTLVLTGAGMPDAACLYFQGTNAEAGGVGTPFGDGILCASGTVTRLGTKVNALGTSSYPAGGDASISVRGSCSAGDVRVYQVWYRNSANFCTSATYNLTSAWRIAWQS